MTPPKQPIELKVAISKDDIHEAAFCFVIVIPVGTAGLVVFFFQPNFLTALLAASCLYLAARIYKVADIKWSFGKPSRP